MSDKFKTIGQAIKFGASITKPLIGHLHNEEKSAACALGAAVIATNIHWNKLAERFKIRDTHSVGYACPLCKRIFGVLGVVTHLNDLHRLPREEIADIVDKLFYGEQIQNSGRTTENSERLG